METAQKCVSILQEILPVCGEHQLLDNISFMYVYLGSLYATTSADLTLLYYILPIAVVISKLPIMHPLISLAVLFAVGILLVIIIILLVVNKRRKMQEYEATGEQFNNGKTLSGEIAKPTKSVYYNSKNPQATLVS